MRIALRIAAVVFMATALLLAPATPVAAQGEAPAIGQPVPDFTLPDMHGKDYRLSDYKGEWVVLEWASYDCPFVKKFYDVGAMQELQETYGAKGVKWFTVVSSAPGNPGYREPAAMVKASEDYGNKAVTTLLDPSGTVGHLFHAQTTPHMFVINPEGVLVYNGAIDDKPSARASDLAGAHNYVAAALDEAMAGKNVSVALTKPYG
jgi:alkyl hydroperoxide reductase subunit AhpC